jgi:hypothetical protein
MNFNFDPTQETHEEYLRRIHLNDKLNTEWNNGQEEKDKITVFNKKQETDIC